MQNESFADIMRDIAQVCFASFVVGSLITDKTNWITVSMGLIISLAFWSANLRIMLKLPKK